ncbi:MAG: arginine--tRNA ligase [Patescibacteria group bacterium]
MKSKRVVEKSENGLAHLVDGVLCLALSSKVFADCRSPREVVTVGTPPNPELGDISVVCFGLAEKLNRKKDVNTVAKQLAAAIPSTSKIAKVSAAGPYVNITFDRAAVSAPAVTAILAENERYGFNKTLAGKTFMVEYLSPNTNKPLHLGHLRNGVIGTTAARLLEACGATVLKANNINDRGIHIIKSMLTYQKFGNGETPESTGEKGDHFVGRYYVRFETELRRLKAEWLKERGLTWDVLSEEEQEKISELFEKECPLMVEAREMLRLWESGDPAVLPLWRRMNQWVLSGFDQSNARLGYAFDRVYYESETYLLGRRIVLEQLERGIGERRPDQAVVVDLSNSKLGTKLLLRADGTSVYMTQDVGLAVTRFEQEGRLDGIIYVVATEQEHHFKVLFELLKRYGYDWASSLYHLSYGMVNLPSGRMKSREGTVVDADNLLDELERSAAQKLGRDGSEATSKEVQRSSSIIAIGALNYYLAAVTPRADMLFDPSSSIEFEGDTGPYIQYSCVRISSIINKAGGLPVVQYPDALTDDDAFALVKALIEFPNAVKQAAQQFNPTILTAALYKTAKTFSSFYRNRHVLHDGTVNQDRLELCQATKVVLTNGLKLLGVGIPERM